MTACVIGCSGDAHSREDSDYTTAPKTLPMPAKIIKENRRGLRSALGPAHNRTKGYTRHVFSRNQQLSMRVVMMAAELAPDHCAKRVHEHVVGTDEA